MYLQLQSQGLQVFCHYDGHPEAISYTLSMSLGGRLVKSFSNNLLQPTQELYREISLQRTEDLRLGNFLLTEEPAGLKTIAP